MNKPFQLILPVIFLVTFGFAQPASAIECPSTSSLQTALDQNISVATILSSCPSIQISDFYGKRFAGGIIGYLEPNRSGKGLILADGNDSTGMVWFSPWVANPYLSAFPGSASTNIGTGQSNTASINYIFYGQFHTSPQDAGDDPQINSKNNWAAYISASSTRAGYSDWFLPSRDELTTILSNIRNTFVDNACGDWWTSSYAYDNPKGTFNAFLATKSGSTQDYVLNNHCVRSVRKLGPWVDSINPPAQVAGRNITINGSNFDPTPGNNTVTFFGGVTSKALSVSNANSSLTVQVPVGAGSGPIQVNTTVNNLVSQSNRTVSFTLPTPQPPTLETPSISYSEPWNAAFNFKVNPNYSNITEYGFELSNGGNTITPYRRTNISYSDDNTHTLASDNLDISTSSTTIPHTQGTIYDLKGYVKVGDQIYRSNSVKFDDMSPIAIQFVSKESGQLRFKFLFNTSRINSEHISTGRIECDSPVGQHNFKNFFEGATGTVQDMTYSGAENSFPFVAPGTARTITCSARITRIQGDTIYTDNLTGMSIDFPAP